LTTEYADVVVFPSQADETPIRYLVPSTQWEEFLEGVYRGLKNQPLIISRSQLLQAVDLPPEPFYEDQWEEEAYEHFKTLDSGDLAQLYNRLYLERIL
jgi:hypothetical protein